jgi:hypothetical protein
VWNVFDETSWSRSLLLPRMPGSLIRKLDQFQQQSSRLRLPKRRMRRLIHLHLTQRSEERW